jgi:hypothetical protein
VPGTTVIERDSPNPASAPTDGSVWFVAEAAIRGDHTKAIRITSPAQVLSLLDGDCSYSFGPTAVKRFFASGGSTVYYGRVVGPTPVKASALIAGAVGNVLKIEADSVGAWGNGATGGLTYAVTNGAVGGSATRQIQVYRNAVLVETSAEFDAATLQAAVDWSGLSSYVRLTLQGGSGLATVAAATNLTGGTDDNANITAAQRAAALTVLSANLGPGQVSMPGITALQSRQDLIAHAQATNRRVVIDGQDLGPAGKATLKSDIVSARAAPGAQAGGTFTPWIVVPGTAAGSTRTIPPCSDVAALIAVTDRKFGPNQPAAGDQGIIRNAIGLTQTFSDADADELNEASQNLIRVIDGQIQVYGWRTLLDKASNPNHWMLSNERLMMYIKARGRAIGKHYVFRKLDGRTLEDCKIEMSGMLLDYYNAGDLVPDPADKRPGTAFRVDVGSNVNTPTTIQAGLLNVEITVRMASFAETVVIGVTKISLQQSV